MTRLIQNPKEQSPEPQKHWIVRLLCLSRKKVLGISAIAGIGAIAYAGLDFWIKKNLPSIVEFQGEKLLNRPVEVGKVKSFSLTGVTLDSFSLPTTQKDPDYVKIDEIKVGFNIIPVIFRGILPLDITLMQPEVYLEQEGDGSWLNLDLPPGEAGESFLSYDLTASIIKGDIKVVPYGESLIRVQLDGKGRYNSKNKEQIEYDLEVAIQKAKATIQGETFLATGTTQTKLLINDLALTDIVSFIPNSPLSLSQGVVNANLDVNIPSWENFTAADVEGTLSIGDVQGEIANREIKADSWLRFGGKDLNVKSLEAKVEDIQAQVTGAIDLQQGYDLDIDILPFNLASLPNTLATELPVPVTGEIKGNLQLEGDIKQPLLTGSIQNTQPITIDKESFKTISANFNADLDKFTLKNLRIVPTVGGLVTATGEITTDFLDDTQKIDLTTMPLNFTIKADLPTEAIAKSYYQFPENINVGNLNSTGTITGTIADPKIVLQWLITEANTPGETINGEGEIILVDNNLLLQDTVIEVGEGKIEISGTSNLEEKTWQTAINANYVDLTPFLTQLELEKINLDRPIAIDNANANLSGKLEASSLNKIQGMASIDLDIDNNPVNIDSKIDQGEITANANTGKIVVNQYISNLPTPITIQSSEADFISKIAPLLQEKPDLSTVKINIDGNLLVASGTINAKASLQNNQWQGNIKGNNLNPSLLSPQLPANLDRINTDIRVSGNIQPLITQQKNIPIKAERVTITTGQQYLNATGDIVLSNLQTNPDIASIVLAINTRLNFNDLSLQDFIPNQEQSLTNIPSISGKGEFIGNLKGKNLLSNPTKLGNLFLTGDIVLNNFAVNNTAFEPVMTGRVNIDPSERLAIVIQGQEDIIAASAEPCKKDRCLFPYLPTSLNFRVNENQNDSIIATGNPSGDIFNVDIVNFPLAILNVTPIKPLGLDSPVGGIVTGDIGINLFSLATKGNITIEKPGVGYIEADRFAAEFEYDVDRKLAQVTTASLLLKDSEYNFNGGINLNSGNIQGKLNIPQAYIQDILTTLNWYTISDAINLFSNLKLSSPQAIAPQNIETLEESIPRKLVKLRQIEQQLQDIAKNRTVGNFPSELDIKGGYKGEVLIAGNINNPEINFAINAQDWTWKPQHTITTFIPSEGVVKQNSQVIAIPEIQLEGEVQNNVLNFDMAKLQVEDTTITIAGTLSPNYQNATYNLDNLTTDTISKFLTIPIDVTGIVNTKGTVTGTLSQPKVTGSIVLTDTTYNKQNLIENITGDYIYQNQKLNFNTNSQESIQIAATVPYPIQPQVNDTITADIKLTTEAFSLLGTLTQDNLTWVGGEANADITTTAQLDLNREIPLYNVRATGEINLDQGQVKTTNLQESITASGTVTLDNQIIEIKTLDGTLANKDLSVTGRFPLLYAVNLENPLTVNIPPGQIELKKLYKGGIAGNIVLRGTAIEPIIGGELALEDGTFFLPKKEDADTTTEAIKATSIIAASNTDTGYQVFAKNFLVKLDEFTIAQQPLYDFAVTGELNLNGTLNNISQLKGEGTLKLVRADVDWFSGNFTLVRSRENLIVFTPEADITNPYLNIQLKSSVNKLSNGTKAVSKSSILDSGANEIPDDITTTDITRRIEVQLNINGEVTKILPVIPESETNGCNVRPNNNGIPSENYTYAQGELDKLATCINFTTFASKSDRALLDSSAVTLSSNPELSQGEIINLLGNQFFSFAEQVSTSNSEELLQLGFNQFIITPLTKRFLYQVEDFVLGVGKSVRLDYLRVFPYIEAVYKINSNLSLRSIYDPKIVTTVSSNSEANNTQDVFELKLEYRLKF